MKSFVTILHPVVTVRKLNIYKTFRRRPGRLLNVSCSFNLLPVSTGQIFPSKMSPGYTSSKGSGNGIPIKPLFCKLQKQLPELFYKKCFPLKFRHIYRKTFLLESPFNKVAALEGLQLCLKRDSNTDVFLQILWSFQEHLFWRTTANDNFRK